MGDEISISSVGFSPRHVRGDEVSCSDRRIPVGDELYELIFGGGGEDIVVYAGSLLDHLPDSLGTVVIGQRAGQRIDNHAVVKLAQDCLRISVEATVPGEPQCPQPCNDRSCAPARKPRPQPTKTASKASKFFISLRTGLTMATRVPMRPRRTDRQTKLVRARTASRRASWGSVT